MNFKDCIDSYPFILMEGALGMNILILHIGINYHFLQQLQQEGPIKNGFIWLDTMNPLLQIMWIFFVP